MDSYSIPVEKDVEVLDFINGCCNSGCDEINLNTLKQMVCNCPKRIQVIDDLKTFDYDSFDPSKVSLPVIFKNRELWREGTFNDSTYSPELFTDELVSMFKDINIVLDHENGYRHFVGKVKNPTLSKGKDKTEEYVRITGDLEIWQEDIINLILGAKEIPGISPRIIQDENQETGDVLKIIEVDNIALTPYPANEKSKEFQTKNFNMAKEETKEQSEAKENSEANEEVTTEDAPIEETKEATEVENEEASLTDGLKNSTALKEALTGLNDEEFGAVLTAVNKEATDRGYVYPKPKEYEDIIETLNNLKTMTEEIKKTAEHTAEEEEKTSVEEEKVEEPAIDPGPSKEEIEAEFKQKLKTIDEISEFNVKSGFYSEDKASSMKEFLTELDTPAITAIHDFIEKLSKINVTEAETKESEETPEITTEQSLPSDNKSENNENKIIKEMMNKFRN